MNRELNPYDPPSIDGPAGMQTKEKGLSLTDGPIAAFHIVLNDVWTSQGLERFWRTRRFSSSLPLAVYAMVVLACWCFDPQRENRGIAGAVVAAISFISGFGMLYFCFGWLTRRTQREHFLRILRSDPDYQKLTIFVLYREGLVSVGPYATSIKKWNCLERAWRFPDGVLLIFMNDHHLWLPIAEMTSGNIDLIDQVLRGKVANYANIR